MNHKPESETTPFALMSPPAARTSDSIAVVWDKPAGRAVERYEVVVDGVVAASTTATDFTLADLEAGREYAIEVRARTTTGALLHSNLLRCATRPGSPVLDVTAYGAAGDGEALNTKAIQAAIDACAPGGTVRIPAGVFLSGALFLKSDMTLHLDEGAVLLGSPETRDYPLMDYRWEGRERLCYASLVNSREMAGERLHDIAVTGTGTIDANGSALRRRELAEAAGCPGRALCIRDADRVYLHGITVRQSPVWCVHLIYCKDVCANGVKINTRSDAAGNWYEDIVNGDGLNPDSCTGVHIFDCDIASEDDCIAIKSGRDAEGRAVGIPTENVRISHCRFTHGFGVAVGSEMAGGVCNVLVEDCVFRDTFSIASVKAPRGRGGIIENIVYRDCALVNKSPENHDCQWFRGALYVDMFYGLDTFDPHQTRPVDDGTSVIRNVRFENIALDTVGGNAIYLTGLPESPLQDIRLANVRAVGKYGFVANNIRGLDLDHVSVEVREGTAMQFVNVFSTCSTPPDNGEKPNA